MRSVGRHFSAWLGACAMAGLGLLLALAGTLGPLPSASDAPGASLVVRVPEAVQLLVVGLLALALLLLLSLQRPRRRTAEEPEPASRPLGRPSMLASLALVVLLGALVYLAWTRWPPGAGHPLDAPLAAITGLLQLLTLARKPPTSLPLFDYAITGLALLFALAVVAVMVLVVLAERLAGWLAGPARTEAAPALETARAEALVDPRAEPDTRAAVIHAYRQYELALAAARAPRAAWQTPSEFMRSVLARVPLPALPVERLTALFELARFSQRPLPAGAREAACDCLDEVKAALPAASPPAEHAR